MKKQIISLLSFLFICGFTHQAMAVCIVTDGNEFRGNGFFGDHLSTDSTFRYKVEEINFGNISGGCSAAGTQDGRVVNDWIAFQTTASNPTGKPVDSIVLNPAWGPIEFKPTVNLLVGNYSHDALNDPEIEDIEYVINPKTALGYRYDGNKIRDYGRIFIDARQMDGIPFTCAVGSGDVFLRNMVIYTNGVTEAELFSDTTAVAKTATGSTGGLTLGSGGKPKVKANELSTTTIATACLKNGGGVFVCDGDPVLKQGEAADSRIYVDPATANPGTTWCQPRIEVGECDDVGTKTVYRDADGDGYGKTESSIEICTDETRSGYVANHTDCDDTDEDIHPGAAEICDGVSNDCDSQIDEGLTSTWYADDDGDNHGNASDTMGGCSQPTDYVADNTDCDDSDANNYPGNGESCDGEDNDCDTVVDNSLTTTWYGDADGDGHGNAAITFAGCMAPGSYVANSDDCDDSMASVYPGAVEDASMCEDGFDQNCDGTDLECIDTPEDLDADGYTVADGDCDDNNASVNPGVDEVDDACEDTIDNDCDGDIDDVDTECGGSGGADEICDNGADDDGDGLVDCADVSDCASAANCNELGAEEVCNDGIDNDEDEFTDCDDYDCQDELACEVAPPVKIEVCNDGIDNDNDGAIDCEDSLCASATECNGVGPEELCDDDVDNDGDEFTDCADYDCLDDEICANAVENMCGDDTDNDGDGFADCDDLDCAGYITDMETGTTCLDLQITPVGDGGFLSSGSGGGCGCDLTASRRMAANDIMPVLAGLLLISLAFGLRFRAVRKEI